MAAPHVSAVAGILWAAYPKCSNSEIRAALQKSAGEWSGFGYGRVQAKAALDHLAANPCQRYLPVLAKAPVLSPLAAF